jgi:hypothetical protein
MNKRSRALSVLTLVAAPVAALVIAAPAHAVTVSESNPSASTQQMSAGLSAAETLYLQRTPDYIGELCGDILRADQAFDWDGPTGGLNPAQRCSDAVHQCVDPAPIDDIDDIVTVQVTNYAGPMGWTPWSVSCSYSPTV